MPTFEQGDVVRVPFPHVDRPVVGHRPALVVSRGALGESGTLLWVVMITSASNRSWPGDVEVREGHRAVGLPVPSLIRTTKIATIESRVASKLGSLSPKLWSAVGSALRDHLGAS